MPPKPPTPDPKAVAAAAVDSTQHVLPLIKALFNLPGLKDVPEGARPFLEAALSLLIYIFLFLALRWLARRLVRKAAERVARRDEAIGQLGRAARVRTLASLLQSILVWALGFVFVIAALGTLGFNLAGVLGTAGVAGLAVGFGAQKLVKDVISGFFLLLEDQYAVGDYVTIGAITGTVEELGMRITRIRDDDGRLFILSNGDITQVCNMSRGPVAGTLEVAVAASADATQAAHTLNEALAKESEALSLAEAARVDGISQVDAAKTTLRIRFRAAPTQRPAEMALRLRQAARDALRDAEIPLG